MNSPRTPSAFARNRCQEGNSSPFLVPPTPMMTRIGYGTGVCVYHVDRSPRFGQERSPWVVKKRNAKVQRGNISQRLLKEAEILRRLNHPNIVGFRGFTKAENGSEVLVMEECSQSLGDFLECFGKDCGSLSCFNIFKVLWGSSNGLHYLHSEQNLLHGDIKSYNILIKGDFETIKLCDFGVSLEIDENGVSKEEYIGSLPWTAPEVLEDGPVTSKADIFALGLTTYEMLTLKTPHTPDFDETYMDKTMDSDMMEASMEEPPYGTRAELPTLGEEYSHLVSLYNWMTEEDHVKRPSAKQVLDAVSSFSNA